MILGREKDVRLNRAFQNLVELEVNVATPFLLELYEDYTSESSLLPKDDFLSILQLIESYVVRRAICDLPSNALNKIFMTFANPIDKSHYLDSASARFKLLSGGGRFPNDEEFKRSLAERDIYNLSKRRNFLLGNLNNRGFDQVEEIIVGNLTIEHIMPQNPELSPEWIEMLGSDWKSIQERHLHVLGNLTLTGYNPSLSDRPFLEKRDMKHGFKDSNVNLTKDLVQREVWNEESIMDRGRRLAERAANVWSYPDPGQESVDELQSRLIQSGETVFAEHHFPANSPLRDLWERLRIRILNIDPSVTEEILKSYIAYKTSTNFVDISSTKTTLHCSRNVEFLDIGDPRSLGEDVTNKSKWGNGDFRLALGPDSDLDYAMGLIGQAYAIRSNDDGFVTA